MQPLQPVQPLQPLQPLQPVQPLHPLQPVQVAAGVVESSAYATETIGAEDKAVNSAATAIVDFFIVLLP